MKHCRTSYQAVRSGRRTQPSGASRMIGPLIVVLAASVWPGAVLAAETAVETQGNAIVVFVVVILLIGSVTAGLLFASPLRRRLSSSAAESEVATASMDAQVRGRLTEATPLSFDHQPSPVPEQSFVQAPEAQSGLERHAWPQPGRQSEPIRPVEQQSSYAPAPTQPQPYQQPIAPVQPQPYQQPIAPFQQPMAPAPMAQPLPMGPPMPPMPRPGPQPQAGPQSGPPMAQPQAAPQPRPAAVPWSTGNPAADVNWNPSRRDAP